MNWFSYANQNPLRFTDPTGLRATDDDQEAAAISDREARRQAYWEARQNAEEARQKAKSDNQKTYSYDELTQGASFDEKSVARNTRNLSEAQNIAMNHPNYQGGSGGVFGNKPNSKNTWCNTSTQAIANATGFNTDYLQADGKILSDSTANDGYDILQKNAAETNNLFIIDSESATKFANVGYTVIGSSKGENGDNGHLSTVAPGYEHDSRSGPMMANVSTKPTTGITSTQRAYGMQRTTLKFYVDLAQFNKDSNSSQIGNPLF